MVVVIIGRRQSLTEEIRRAEQKERLRAVEEERERMARILRGLQERAMTEAQEEQYREANSNENSKQDNTHIDCSILEPCISNITGHLIDWYTSGFQ